jgi:hypothetical protein
LITWRGAVGAGAGMSKILPPQIFLQTGGKPRR